jgi:GGDEF domain-containing protein
MLRISNQERYREERSKHNNKTMFIIAVFLLVEQMLYGGTFLTFILLNNHVNNGVLYPTFVEDILMNSILAWIGSFLAHYRFLKQVNSFVRIEEQNKALIQLSEIDALTQIHNRRALDRELEVLHRKAQEKSGTYAMIIADIDYFKKVNDKYGHIIGDEVLVETVRRFKRIIGDKHIIGRWGVTSEDVVRKTDKALYFSKENGRNQVNVEV